MDKEKTLYERVTEARRMGNHWRRPIDRREDWRDKLASLLVFTGFLLLICWLIFAPIVSR